MAQKDGIKPYILRDDVSCNLVHLVRDHSSKKAEDVFMEILNSKTFKGGTGCIRDKFNCVCFSEAPISKLGQVLALPGVHGMRYKPFGFMVSKEWLYEKGGRPVIYQSDSEYSLLPGSLKYRHVRYEPPLIDFSWEREWRIQTNELQIDPAITTVIVPNRSFVEKIKQDNIDKMGKEVQLMGMVTLGVLSHKPLKPLAWHFIVLEDLGIPIPN
ncbi:MAG TPA: hypothetical protein PKB02_19140 [Anaerohalosphaeraceae bacterium]|nr:hypothetical protein [Anaerohalosphaeraceae bacterium]